MNITFFDTNMQVCDALTKEFAGIQNVEVCRKDLSGLGGHDCLVTAGNSYGIMNGGIDRCVRNMLGIEFQDSLQWFIVEHYGGRLPIGCNLVLECSHDRFRRVIYAPTMERPNRIVPNDIFVVFYNILKTSAGLGVSSLACCGLGTGCGGIPPAVHAGMLKEAYALFMVMDGVQRV